VEARTPTEDLDAQLRMCCRRTALDGAGVSLVATEGSREPFHATDDVAWEIERLHLMLGEGPGIDASTDGIPVLVADISDGIAGRWPMFRHEAARAGVLAIFAFPVRMGAVNIGTVDLYRTQPGHLSERQFNTALSSVGRVAATLHDQPTGYADHDPAAASDVLVHQAAGRIMIQIDGSIEEAVVRLRSTAFAEGCTVSQLAADVVHGRRRFSKEGT
jgi:hypothetical protein